MWKYRQRRLKEMGAAHAATFSAGFQDEILLKKTDREERANHFTMSSRNSTKQFAGIQFLSPPPCYCRFSSRFLGPLNPNGGSSLCLTGRQFCRGNKFLEGKIVASGRGHCCSKTDRVARFGTHLKSRANRKKKCLCKNILSQKYISA